VNPEREKYLNLRTKPGKVTAEEAAWHLGFLAHEIPILLSAGLLPPLGEPAENGVKFFSTNDLDKLNQDRAWLSKACNVVVKYWKDRNLLRPTRNAQGKWTPRRYGGAIRPRTDSKPLPLSSRPKRKPKP
jgi:hypothetical protein